MNTDTESPTRTASPEQPSGSLKLAMVQMDIQLGDLRGNLEKITAYLREAAHAGAQLIVFPECATSGYCTDSYDETRKLALPVHSFILEQIQSECQKLGVHAIYGQLELASPQGSSTPERVFNAAVAVSPQGLIGVYHKTHLPFLGADRFTAEGPEPLRVLEIAGVKVGILICYDGAFPEPSRVLALAGADLIVLPTNWPEPAQVIAAHACQIRAMENTVFFASASRVGTERGTRFIGQSRICSHLGHELVRADDVSETIIYATIQPQLSRQKHLVRTPGESEINRLGDRRVDLYQSIVAPEIQPSVRQSKGL